MKHKRNPYLTLLLFLALISLVSLVSDENVMGFYQLNALSLSSFSLPEINQSTIIIAISVLLVVIISLAVVWFLRKKKKNIENSGQEILNKTEAKEKIAEKPSPSQSINDRLAQYVKDARTAGLSDEVISGKLREAGWPEEEIKKAF